jgi:hypothetical protein
VYSPAPSTPSTVGRGAAPGSTSSGTMPSVRSSKPGRRRRTSVMRTLTLEFCCCRGRR